MSKSNRNRRLRKARDKSLQYEHLEPRKLLAVTGTFDMGAVDIVLTEAMDQASLDAVDGNVTVNGELLDADLDLDGLQPVAIDDVISINVVGSDGLTDLAVEFDGDFDTGMLSQITIQNINQVSINGSYSANSLTGELVGPGGSVSGNGEIRLSGLLQLSDVAGGVGNFDVSLFSANDFETISIRTIGDVELRDVTSLVIGDLTAENLTLEAGGFIADDSGATIVVTNHTDVRADTIELGANGFADLFTLTANTEGSFVLNNNDALGWRYDSTIGSATITANELVSFGPFASLNILGDAAFDAPRAELGVGDGNTFNSGRLRITADQGLAEVHENSSVLFYGFTETNVLLIVADGDITNDDGATIFVRGLASFEATGSIDLGNRPDDRIFSVTVQFSGDRVDLNSRDVFDLVGDNFANELRLESESFIRTRFGEVSLEVAGNATFISNGSTRLGATSDLQSVRLGSVSFDTNTNFILFEDDDTVVTSPDGFLNRAGSGSRIQSAGDLTNDAGTQIRIDAFTTLAGKNIEFGNAENDDVRFFATELESAGNVELEQDNRILFFGESTVGGDVSLRTDQVIRDDFAGDLSFFFENVSFEVDGQASFFGSSINLGDVDVGDEGDFFSVGSLRFESAGNVNITQDGSVVLAGDTTHSARALRLNSVNGPIRNLSGAVLDVARTMHLFAAGDIDLGVNEGDSVTFDNLRFNTSGSVRVIATFDDLDNDIFIVGSSTAREFRLITNVAVRDGTNAFITVDDFVRIEATDILLGDTETDCLMFPESPILIASAGSVNVTADESCPS